MQKLREALKNKSVCLSLLIILAVGCVLRFYGLENQSLWGDELTSWSQSSFQNLSLVIDQALRGDVHPPGYKIFLFFIEQIGDSEFILRLPSAISGVLAIFFIFILGLELYTYKEALMAAALTAVSRYPIYYSQEARAYSMLLLFTLITAYLWIKLLKSLNSNDTKKTIYLGFCYLIAAVICSYLHYFGLLLIILQITALILFSLNKFKALIICILISFSVGFAYMPWLSTILIHLDRRPALNNPPMIMGVFYDYIKFTFNGSFKISMLVFTFYAALLSLSFYNITIKKKNINLNRLNSGLLLSLWLIVPFLIAYAKSFSTHGVLTNRNLIICLPAVYILFSRAITKLPLPSMLTKSAQVSVAILLLFHTIFITGYYFAPHKAQFREAVSFIVDSKQIPANKSLIIGYAWTRRHFGYYFSKKGSDLEVAFLAGKKEDIEGTFYVIDKEKPQYIWYINGSRKPDKEFIESLENRLDLISCTIYYGAKVWLFRNPRL